MTVSGATVVKHIHLYDTSGRYPKSCACDIGNDQQSMTPQPGYSCAQLFELNKLL